MPPPQDPLKRKRQETAGKRIAKLKADVESMNKLHWWLACLVTYLSENAFEMDSPELDWDCYFKRAAEKVAYTPKVDVAKALDTGNPKLLEPAALKAVAILIGYLKQSGPGEHEIVDVKESRKRLNRLEKAAKELPQSPKPLTGTRLSHVRIVADVMAYAEEEFLGNSGVAIELFEDILQEAQQAGHLPR